MKTMDLLSLAGRNQLKKIATTVLPSVKLMMMETLTLYLAEHKPVESFMPLMEMEPV